jgi:hypothetical protein
MALGTTLRPWQTAFSYSQLLGLRTPPDLLRALGVRKIASAGLEAAPVSAMPELSGVPLFAINIARAFLPRRSAFAVNSSAQRSFA